MQMAAPRSALLFEFIVSLRWQGIVDFPFFYAWGALRRNAFDL
jgi:hypothetical protein